MNNAEMKVLFPFQQATRRGGALHSKRDNWSALIRTSIYICIIYTVLYLYTKNVGKKLYGLLSYCEVDTVVLTIETGQYVYLGL